MLNRLTVPFVGVLLALWLVLGSWWYGATYCTAHNAGVIPGLSLVDDNFEISALETFSFYNSGADPILNPSVNKAFESLAYYLIDHPEKQLTLFGVYSPGESTPVGFDNLGQARADAIRSILLDQGVPKNSIKVKGGIFGNASFVNDIMYGGVYFRFKNVNESPNEPIVGEGGRSTDLFQAVNIYFDVNEYDLILTDQLEAYLEDVKSFLYKNSNAQIAIIGHADKNGSGAANLNLSETRARNVKKFMIRSGFDPRRLVIEYKGEEDPMMADDTERALRKNRRVELRLRNR